MQRTLVLLKPDCVQRRLVGRVLARLEEKGLNVIALKLMRVTPELARQHYAEHVSIRVGEVDRYLIAGNDHELLVWLPENVGSSRRRWVQRVK